MNSVCARVTDPRPATSELADTGSFYATDIALRWELDLKGRLARAPELVLAENVRRCWP